MADRRLAWALVAVIVRYLTTIQPHAKRELARWRQHALAIPDPELRAHVLRPFDADGSAIGASLFAVLAPLRMQRRLVRLLIAYVLLWSYVDVRTERDPDADPRLYDALVDALKPGAASDARITDESAGYLAALLAACSRGCAALPQWHVIQSVALGVAEDGRVIQAINHGPRAETEARLRAWASSRSEGSWPERCAAASSPLAIHALMALAAQRVADAAQAPATAVAYEPVSALGVVWDHLIDRSEDQVLSKHSYLDYVDTQAVCACGLHDLAERAARGVRSLPAGERHVVVVAAMVAMFVSQAIGCDSRREWTGHEALESVGPPARQLSMIMSLALRLRTTGRSLAQGARATRRGLGAEDR